MEPWQSWTAALVVGGALAFYYTRGTNVATKVTRAVQGTEQPQTLTNRRREDKKQGRNKSAISNAAEKSKEAISTAVENTSEVITNATKQSQKKKSAQKGPASKPEIASLTEVEEDEPEDEGDKEWAAQLEARKKGISLAATSNNIKQPVKKKQPKSTASESSSAPAGSSMAFMAGLTAQAPTVRETTTEESAPIGGDVSDMLEARNPAPSVLRIVGEEKPKKQQAPKPEVAQETKKQRQNRKKVEEQRLIREQQEKERQVLAEKQRRTAREARGEPMKNGLAPSKAPVSNAWYGPSQTSLDGPESTSQTNGVELLDTFDQDDVSTGSSNGVVTVSTTPATANSTSSIIDQSYPSEEAQLERINEMTGWAEVSKSKKGKKKTQPQPEESDVKEVKQEIKQNVSAPIKTPSQHNAPKPALVPSTKEEPATNGALKPDNPFTIAHAQRVPNHPDDSEWL